MIARQRSLLVVLVAASTTLLIASALILVAGRAPGPVYAALAAGTWGNAYGIGQVLFKATPLLTCGLSVWLALRAGLFNVGAEGQLIVGAFACGLTGAYLPAATPSVVAVPLCLLAAAGGGAVVGLIPGWLKARRGAHEVITTIMMNFVVRAATLGAGLAFFERESVHTRPVIDGAHLARLSRWVPGLRGSAASAGLIVAVLVTAATAWALRRTRLGFRLRAVGAQPRVAQAVGYDVERAAIVSLSAAGAIAGLGGANFVLGYKGYYEDGFSGGVGFVGIAVAVLAGRSALALCLAALLFGTLGQGQLAVNAICPKEIVDVMQAVLIVAASAAAAQVARARRAAA